MPRKNPEIRWKMKAGAALWGAVRLAWAGLAFAILFAEILHWNPAVKGSGVLLVYFMLPACFPAGLIVPFTYFVLHEVFGYLPPSTLANLVFDWYALFVAGYIQWFWVLPRAVDRTLKWMRRHAVLLSK